MTEIYETQSERTDLPLVVMPSVLDSMIEPIKAQFPALHDVARVRMFEEFTSDEATIAERLKDAAALLAQSLDVDIRADFTPVKLERPFYGVYYGQAALPMEPDELWVLESDSLYACTTYNIENRKTAQVYDMEKLSSRDLYDVFLSGPVSVLTVENPAANTEKELIVFRDSFGSSMVPLLIPGYAKVTLVDIRYLPADKLGEFVEFGNQDVLFLYSTLVLNQSSMLK